MDMNQYYSRQKKEVLHTVQLLLHVLMPFLEAVLHSIPSELVFGCNCSFFTCRSGFDMSQEK